jgi:hypothetical protein
MHVSLLGDDGQSEMVSICRRPVSDAERLAGPTT